MLWFHEKAISSFLWLCLKLGLQVLLILPLGFKVFSVGHILILEMTPVHISVHAHMKKKSISPGLNSVQINFKFNFFFTKLFLCSLVIKNLLQKAYVKAEVHLINVPYFSFFLKNWKSPWLFHWAKLTDPSSVCALGVGPPALTKLIMGTQGIILSCSIRQLPLPKPGACFFNYLKQQPSILWVVFFKNTYTGFSKTSIGISIH